MSGPEQKEKMRFEMDDPQMYEFERALSRAMRRVEVPAETTAKLYALAEEAERKRANGGGGFRLIKFSNGGRVFAMPRIPQARAWMGGAIAAVLVLGCFAGAHMHTEHERRVQAERQFEASQRITDETLAHMRQQLHAQGIYLDE